MRLEGTTVGSSGPTSLLQQGHPRAQGTGLCPEGSGISPVRETPCPLWTICSGLGHCPGQKFCLMSRWNFLGSVPARSSGAEPGPCSEPSLQIAVNIDGVPSQSSLPHAEQAQLSCAVGIMKHRTTEWFRLEGTLQII